MVNINLSTGGNESSGGGIPYKKSLITIIVILVITAGVYAGLLLYTQRVVQADADANAQYSIEYDKLSQGNAKEVYDFQSRMDLASNLMAKGDSVVPSLQELEKVLVPGVYVSSYAYVGQDKTIKLACVGDKFETVAKQILSFKSSNLFSSVSAGETMMTTDGKINFTLNMGVK